MYSDSKLNLYAVVTTSNGMDSKELGFLAENIASRYLESGGYQIIEKNYRKPWGEIDIIAQNGEVLVFVEVKANRKEFSGDFNPESRVDWKKLGKITKTAELYMQYEAGNTNREWQVDVIAVTFDSQKKKAKIRHFKNV